MEMKKAAAVCFISLFAATLVVLIARALDIQAASKIQPELQKIAAELEMLRKQVSGNNVNMKSDAGSNTVTTDGLAIYYAHGNTRCPTCEAIESQAIEAVTSGFADELKDGSISWNIVNYEEPTHASFKNDYGVHVATVVLVQMKDGKPGEGKRLDEVWGLYTDKAACIKFIQAEIRKMLEPAEPETPEASGDMPLPTVPLPEPEDAPLPLPMAPPK